MVKKAKTKLKIKKICQKLEAQIQEQSEMFFHKLQGVPKESCDTNDSDRFIQEVSFHTKNTRKSPLRKNSTFSCTNIRNEDIIRDNYICYRCKHFLEIPRNLSSQPFSDGVSFVEQCKDKLSFIQAIVWLKSSIPCLSQMTFKQLQQTFNEQGNTRNEYNHCKDERDIEQSRSSIDKDVPRTNTKDTIVTSTPLNTVDVSSQIVTSQRTISSLYIRSEDPRSKPLNYFISASDPNEFVESLILGSSSSSNITARENKKEVKSCIILETDAESTLNDDPDISCNVPEHQLSFGYEKDTRCSVQIISKNGIKQTNKKIIKNKHIFQKSHADVSNERKYILLARNKSIDPMFEYNYNRELDKSFISMRSQNYLANETGYLANKLEFDGSPKSFITPKDVSQISNNEYFEFLLDDNSPWRASNTAAGSSNEDSAYSTSRIDMFNCDIAVGTGPLISHKRVLDTEHYYELQPCKKTVMYEKEKVSPLTNKMLASDGSPRSCIITEKDISQISNVYNDENCKFQEIRDFFGSDNNQISDVNFENSEDDTMMTMESIIGNKRTKNIELHPHNEKTVTRQEASPSIIQRSVIPHTNIKKASLIIRELKERKSEQAKNLHEEENENENEIISIDWLNFTVDSLHMKRAILTSIKVILSTLCNQRMVEKYMIRQQLKKTRNYWKGSLEEEAINAVLNISNIFTIEEIPNIFIKIIIMEIVKTLDEIMRCEQLYKIYCIQTSVWIYRVQIILELCNSLPICVKVTDYLITKLKSLQSLLIDVRKISKDNCVSIKQLHLVFYALNITLRKYRTIIPNDQRSAEKLRPHVENLWKVYIDKELEYTSLNLDTAEKQWLNALENSAVAFTNFRFAKFADKSFSLVHVLISQSSTTIT